jgi:hypothetical protein
MQVDLSEPFLGIFWDWHLVPVLHRSSISSIRLRAYSHSGDPQRYPIVCRALQNAQNKHVRGSENFGRERSCFAGSECLCRRTGFYTPRRSSRKSYLSLKMAVWKVMGERFLWVSPSSSWKHKFYVPKKQNTDPQIHVTSILWPCKRLFTIIFDFPIFFPYFGHKLGVHDGSSHCETHQVAVYSKTFPTDQGQLLEGARGRPTWAILGHFDILLTGQTCIWSNFYQIGLVH